jgi:hypothetical protein
MAHYSYHNGPPTVFYASETQIGQDASSRNQPGVNWSDRQFCHQVVHSADRTGAYAHTPNAHRDLTKTYDPSIQARLDHITAIPTRRS